jgi:rod shape determining protein RodA
LLLFAFFEGTVVRGARSWIVIGGNQFQPSELAKIALILMLAGFFMKRYIAAWNLKNIILSFFYVAIPGGIIALQPDFGSAAVVFGIWIGFLLMSGLHIKRFLVLAGICIAGFVCLWSFVLMPYQKDRITGFLFPDKDPLGINYNIIQSKIAIGSAGLFGKGFGEGTQVHFKFLPEFHADFFFAGFVEEWGILGGIMLIGLYFLIIHRVLVIGKRSRSNDAKFISLGTATLLLIHFLVNVGSNLGIVPVTGITLPFLSYGGSSLLTLGLLMGIIEHIRLESSN